MDEGEKVIIGQFEKNKREQIIVSLRRFKGNDLIDTRLHYPDEAGELQPSSKGVSIKPAKLDSLIDALTKAREECERRGLLEARDA